MDIKKSNPILKKFFLSTIGLLAFSLIGTRASAEMLDKVVATVNQEPITQYDLDRAVETINQQLAKTPEGKKGNIPAQELKKMALDHLIDETLLSQEIEKQGIKITDQDVSNAIASILKRNNMTLETLKKELVSKGTTFESYQADIRNQLKRFRFIGQAVGSKVKLSDEDVQAYYEQNFDKVKGTQEIHISQIVFPLSAQAPNEELNKTLAKAQEVYKKAKSGTSFDNLMKQYGGDGSGDLGKINFSGLSPQLVPALQNLEAGEVSEPIRTPIGILIVKLLEKPEAGLKGSEEIKANIRDQIYEMKMQEEIKKYVDQLKGKAFIDIKS
jgi:peptidyl-prolyl cis-trans isomerase SurA